MAIKRVSYAYAEPEGPSPLMTLRTVSADVSAYLMEHVEALVDHATDKSPPAVFLSNESSGRMNRLMSGAEADFLDAGQTAADRIFKGMDRRASRGFIVALQLVSPARGVVLKLDVHDSTAAALSTESGIPTLEAIKDLLDIPGELQKGAVFPDQRSDSDVIVGDSLAKTSLYFLHGLELEQHVAAGPATAEFLGVVHKIAPAKTEDVAAALESQAKTSVAEFLEENPDLLTLEERELVVGQTRSRKRPIADIDPQSHALREELEADGIVIRGRSTTLRQKLTVSPRLGGYRIVVDVQEEPSRRYI